MDCLLNYIQIEGCNAPAYDYSIDVVGPPPTNTVTAVAQAPSGLFINKDLPINLEQIDKIADSEQESFIGVWSEVQKSGIKKFILRVKAGYKELFNCSISNAWICENRDHLALSLLYFLGSELMFERLYSDRINRYTVGIDKQKARDLRAEFDAMFTTTLKDGLEVANPTKTENGEIYTYIEVIP